MESQKTGTCSFCLNEGKLLRSNLSGKAICWECVYAARAYTEEMPTGAICCLSCNAIEGFIIYYPAVRVEWIFNGMDIHESVIYSIKTTSGLFTRAIKPIKVTCIKCYNKIPLWVLKTNKYVKQAHTT